MKSSSLNFIFSLAILYFVSCSQPIGGNSEIQLSSTSSYPDCTNDFLGSCVIKGANKGALDSNLIASNIASGVTIFGITGTYTELNGLSGLSSNMHRNRTTTQITIQNETITNTGVPYSSNDPGYRAVPKIGKDDDGYSGGNVVYVDRTTWAATTCGTLQSTIALRIADCATVFGANATWAGATQGNAGQSTWKLVTRTANRTNGRGREVWRDERTGLLWSSLISGGTDGKTINWCKTTGSNNIPGNPAAEDDLQDFCDNAPHQNVAGLAISACFEDGGTFFTDADASIDSAGKAGLDLSSTPSVAWRVPSKYDQAQAEIDGIRFVLPDAGPLSVNYEWASTTYTDGRNNAWIYSTYDGIANYNSRALSFAARCVGR